MEQEPTATVHCREEESKKVWFEEVVGIYRENSTGKEYARYNNSFVEWHAIKYGKKDATESSVRAFV